MHPAFVVSDSQRIMRKNKNADVLIDVLLCGGLVVVMVVEERKGAARLVLREIFVAASFLTHMKNVSLCNDQCWADRPGDCGAWEKL